MKNDTGFVRIFRNVMVGFLITVLVIMGCITLIVDECVSVELRQFEREFTIPEIQGLSFKIVAKRAVGNERCWLKSVADSPQQFQNIRLFSGHLSENDEGDRERIYMYYGTLMDESYEKYCYNSGSRHTGKRISTSPFSKTSNIGDVHFNNPFFEEMTVYFKPDSDTLFIVYNCVRAQLDW